MRIPRWSLVVEDTRTGKQYEVPDLFWYALVWIIIASITLGGTR